MPRCIILLYQNQGFISMLAQDRRKSFLKKVNQWEKIWLLFLWFYQVYIRYKIAGNKCQGSLDNCFIHIRGQSSVCLQYDSIFAILSMVKTQYHIFFNFSITKWKNIDIVDLVIWLKLYDWKKLLWPFIIGARSMNNECTKLVFFMIFKIFLWILSSVS